MEGQDVVNPETEISEPVIEFYSSTLSPPRYSQQTTSPPTSITRKNGAKKGATKKAVKGQKLASGFTHYMKPATITIDSPSHGGGSQTAKTRKGTRIDKNLLTTNIR